MHSRNGFSEGATYTITDDSAAEPNETITLAVPAFVSTSPDNVTPGDPLTITILANDGYVAPVTPAPATDNPAARMARVKAPAAAIARGIGQLAADAIARRVGSNGDGRIGLWTGGGVISTDGKRDNIAYDGDTNALHIGVDRKWRDGLLGVSIATNSGDMDFNNADNLDADVTSIHPYLSRNFGNKRIHLTIGHGSGDAELTEGNAAPIKTDLTLTTAAVGLTVSRSENIKLSATATHTRAKLDAATAGARRLPSTTADATRLSAAAELSRQFANGARPFLTVNVRHDSGDDEQGTAGDLGGGVEWQTPAVHFRLQGAAHVGGDGGEEQRFGLTLRRAFGGLDLGLNLGVDGAGLDAGRLLTGEWRF